MSCCNKCGSANGCGCSVTVSLPYYKDTPICAEDNCQILIQPAFTFSICPSSSWNVPLCGQTAVLSVPGLAGATVGSYIWSPTYGYFEITSLDDQKGLVGITNNCTLGNASPGVQIPACTCFVVTVPPVDTGTTTGVCVLIDFTAPDVNVPTDITLTSTEGLQSSDTIQIGTGFYFIEAVKPNNIITIENRGQGIVPGTPVIAKDASGNLQYCLSVISSNPCDAEAAQAARLIGCNADGNIVPLGDVCQQGYMPVVIDDECNSELLPIITPIICTHTTVAVNIVNGDPTYTFTISDSSNFIIGDILTVSGLGATRATITNIPDATSIDVTLVPTPGVTSTLAAGALVCTINCCEEINNVLDTVELQVTHQGTSALVTPGTISTVTTVNGNTLNLGPYTNPTLHNLTYIATIEYMWGGNINIDEDGPTDQQNVLAFIPQYATVVGAIGATVAPAPVTDTFVTLSLSSSLGGDTVHNAWPYGQSYTHVVTGTIVPGNEVRISSRAVQGVTLIDTTDTNSIDYTRIETKMTVSFLASP